jgi:hypothetical protein
MLGALPPHSLHTSMAWCWGAMETEGVMNKFSVEKLQLIVNDTIWT